MHPFPTKQDKQAEIDRLREQLRDQQASAGGIILVLLVIIVVMAGFTWGGLGG